MSALEQADGCLRMAQAHLQGAHPDPRQARMVCDAGLRVCPGHPGLTAILSSLPPVVADVLPVAAPPVAGGSGGGGGGPAGSCQYRVEKTTVLTPSLDPEAAVGQALTAGQLIQVTDVVVFKGVTRLRARCPDVNDATGWVDEYSAGERNVGQHPYVERQSKPSARAATADCVMAGELHKKGSVLWNKRFFVISPASISPEFPDRYLYYYEKKGSAAPKDVIRLLQCRALSSNEHAHCLKITCSTRSGGNPDSYSVHADSAGDINAWKNMIEKLTTGETSVPPAFAADGGAPAPEPEPEAAVLAPVFQRPRRISWVINPEIEAAGNLGATVLPSVDPVAPESCGFDYLFEVENKVNDEIRVAEERAVAELEAEEAAREEAEAEAAVVAAAAAEREARDREEAATAVAEAARLQREAQAAQEAADVAAAIEREHVERERVEAEAAAAAAAEAAEKEENSAGKWLAENVSGGLGGEGPVFRSLYEAAFSEHGIDEYLQMHQLGLGSFQGIVDRIVPPDKADHKQCLQDAIVRVWDAEKAERDRIEAERLREEARLAAEAAEAARLEQERLEAIERARVEEERARDERARLEHEALVTVQREEEERARRDELQRKIKNAQDTNTMLRADVPGSEQMVASNLRDIAMWEAERTGQQPPPVYQQPQDPPPYGGGGGGSGPPAYEPPPYDGTIPVEPSPAPTPAPLSSRDATLRMLALEQIKACGSSGITAAMLKGRLASTFGLAAEVEDVIRLTRDVSEVSMQIKPDGTWFFPAGAAGPAPPPYGGDASKHAPPNAPVVDMQKVARCRHEVDQQKDNIKAIREMGANVSTMEADLAELEEELARAERGQ